MENRYDIYALHFDIIFGKITCGSHTILGFSAGFLVFILIYVVLGAGRAQFVWTLFNFAHM